jgi:hypothetical protein
MALCFIEVCNRPEQNSAKINWRADGEWIPSIVDDNLYLSTADWDSQTEYGTFSIERYVLEKSELEDKEKEHLKLHQTGSKALWGGHCRNENETWLPLLEKAYAKAHGDYYSMNGGWPGYVNLPTLLYPFLQVILEPDKL